MNVELELGRDERPVGARGETTVAAPPDRVWAVIADVPAYAGRIPMVDRVRLDGTRAQVHLKLKISFFSVKFDFVAEVVSVDGRRLELRGVSGEPAALVLIFEVEPAASGGTRLGVTVSFDVTSLGWLVKYFLKHHPEIEFGVFPGTALVLLDSIKRAASSK
jgi:carbon monoxide dehydrogenase subunit G